MIKLIIFFAISITIISCNDKKEEVNININKQSTFVESHESNTLEHRSVDVISKLYNKRDSINKELLNSLNKKSKEEDSLSFPTSFDYKDAFASHYKFYINKAYTKEIFYENYKDYQNKKLDSLIENYGQKSKDSIN